MSGDPKLAEMMRSLKVPAPMENIVETDMLLTIVNHLRLDGRRVVRLACGHRKITSAAMKTRCDECHRMILNGEDYDGFRNVTRHR
jgi:hypothetical protein